MTHSNAKTHQRSSFRNLFIRGPSTTRTVNMAVGQIIPFIKKPENSSLECGSSQETSNLWIKRLRPHLSDSLPSSSKRLKTSENEYQAQARNLLGMILNTDHCNRYLSKCLEGRQELKSTPLLTEDGDCAYEESKAMNNWIQRWCCRSRQAVPLRKVAPERSSVMAAPLRKVAPERSSVMAASLQKVAPERSSVMAASLRKVAPERSSVLAAPLRKVAPVLCEPERSSVMAAPLRKVAPVLCEPQRSRVMRKAAGGKQLPSIAAMALMKAAMKGSKTCSKTCRYKKKGSLLVWNI